jgi:HK97 family phage major capsid protein
MAEILRENLAGTIPEDIAKTVVEDTYRGSSVMKLCKLEPMTTETKRIPVSVSGPGAYWISDTERIQTSNATWITVSLVAKKLGVIVPIDRDRMNDSVVDVMSEVKSKIAEAFAISFDAAALFGTQSPFARSIFGAAVTSGHKFVRGTVAGQDFASDISDCMALVEDAGLDVTGFIGHHGLKNQFRKLRDTAGNPIYLSGLKDGTVNELYNNEIEFVRTSAFDKSKADLIAGNFDYAYYSVLDDIRYEILTEATLQSVLMADGKPLSLAEQDMIAIKAVMRVAFAVIKEDAFAVLEPSTTH